MHRLVLVGFVVWAAFGSASFVHAANKTWTSAVSGDFTDATKWTGGVPGAADSATFNAGGIYTITFDNVPVALANPVLNQDLFFQSGAVRFVSGSGGPYTYRLTGAGGDDAVITGGSLALGGPGNPLHLTVDDDLSVRGNATLSAEFGSDVTTADLILGDSTAPTGDGTLIIDGAGSTLTVNASAQLGTGGETGTLAVRNSATADFNGTLGLADATGSNFSRGVMHVHSNATVTTGNIRIAPNAVNGQTATLDVGNGSGTSTVTQDLNATLVIGAALASPTANFGHLNVNAGGVFNTGGGSGTVSLGATGTINVAGTINVNGNITVNGGAITRIGSGVLNLATGRTLTAQNNAQIDLGGDTALPGATSWLINTGADLTDTGSLDIGNIPDPTSVTIDGIGSSLATGAASTSEWGRDGHAAVFLRNNAVGNVGSIDLARPGGFSGIIRVESGADLNTQNLRIADLGGAITNGLITVTGSGSTLTQAGTSTLTLGHTTEGIAEINVNGGGAFTTGTGATMINKTGKVTIGDASGAGDFNANGNVTINGGILERGDSSTFDLAAGKTMTIENGGRATFTGSYTTAPDTMYNISGTNVNPSRIETLGTSLFEIKNGAQINVNTWGRLSTSGSLAVGVDGSNATLSIEGSGARVIHGAGSVTVGHASTGTANVNIGTTVSGSVLETNGPVTINATGKITVGAVDKNGTLDAGGNVTIDGGTLELRRNASFFFSVQNGTVNVINGGRLTYLHDDFIFIPVNVNSAGSISGAGTLRIFQSTVVVDGIGSSVSAASGTWGFVPFASPVDEETRVTLRNGATGSYDASLSIGDSSTATSSTDARIESGADLTVGSLVVTPLSNQAALTVTGAGSSVTVTPNGNFTVGGADSGGALVDIVSGGSLIVGAGGRTTVSANGTIRIDGGTVDLKTLLDDGGTIDFRSGSLSFVGHLRVGAGGALESPLTADVTLSSGQQLTVTTTSIDASSTLTLNGGTLNTESLDINGVFVFNSGTLGIAPDELVRLQPAGLIQTSRSIGAIIDGAGTTSTINVSASGISLGNASNLNGFRHEGVLNIGANTVTLNSAGYARVGALTSLAGGTINAPNGVSLASSSNFLGNGAINGRVVGEIGAVTQADGPLTLGDTNSPAGFNFGGELRTRQHAVTLHSSAQASLGNLTTLGSGATPGTLNAPNGFVVDFGEAVTGVGTMNSTNAFAKRAIVNGTVQGNSAAQPITLTGYVKGVGTFTNVNFTGTFDPGLSPTIITGGSMSFGATNTLRMELGGTARGSQYDAIISSGTLGLDGTLLVELINGFAPSAGNSFDILDWGSVSGTFDVLELPAIGGGLTWDTSQLYTAGVLAVMSVGLPGDYNNNGVVDAADFVVWRKNLGGGTSLPNDDTAGVGPDDYNRWRANFDRTAGAGAAASASASIPEPHSLVVVLAAAASLFTSSRPNRRAAKAECRQFICT